MTMGEYGLNFERTQTWWKQGKGWIDYIARCEYLLQQGKSVADVAYFTGESAPVEMRAGNPKMPTGYDWDSINADVLLHGATVDNGRIKLTSGISYGVLVLPPDDSNLSPPTLECISKLVHAGATVLGPRPQHAPGLTDYPHCDQRVKELTDDLWGSCDGKTVLENSADKGRIVLGKPLGDVLAAQKLEPDFEFKGAADGANLAYIHRTTGDADIYFVSNQKQQFQSIDCTFRVTGKQPELWHPDTGLVEPAPVWSENNGRTNVSINFDPAGSVFVLFRETSSSANQILATHSTIGNKPLTAPKIQIQHAVYAAVDGSGQSDVTSKLAAMFQNGNPAPELNNDIMGGDPATMHEKVLRIDYVLNGESKHAVIKEKQSLMLPPVPTTGEPPLWEITTTSDGKPAVRAWANGEVNLRSTTGTSHATATNVSAPMQLPGPWALYFPPHLGAPSSVRLNDLISWTDHTDPGVRYFSGTAAYQTDFTVIDPPPAGDEFWLDLGVVKNFAEVSLNGKDLGLLWKPPFRVNVTQAIHRASSNKLVIKITNLWPNRIIGDEHLPPDCEWKGQRLAKWPQWLLDGKPSPTGRITFATWHHWNKDAPLLESGLIGPVTLRVAEVLQVK